MRFHDEPSREAYDAIVVGAGIGGLTTAALLANAGRSVLVVERHNRVGGYAHAFRRGPYLFDSAVHMVGGCKPVAFPGGGAIHSLLETLGLEERCHFRELDPVYRAVLPGTAVDAPSGLDEFELAHAELFPKERKGIADFIQECLDIREQTQRASELSGPFDVIRDAKRFPSLLRHRRATLQEVLDAQIGDAGLKAALGALWPYLGLPPSQVSFLYYATMLMSYVADRSYYCEGSFQRFADTLAAGITEREGELLLRSSVRRIETDAQGRACGVVLENGARVRAPIVVSNADATQTALELLGREQLPTRYVRSFERRTPSISAFVVYAACEGGLASEADCHETFFYGSPDHDEAYRTSLAGRPDWFTLTVPTLADPQLAPPDEDLLVLTTLVPYDVPGGWREQKDAVCEHMLELLEARLSGVRARLRFCEAGSPRTMERYTRNRDGAIYGWALSPREVGPGRLGVRTPVEGLYLSGHWAQPGGGIYGVVTSGLQTARAILGEG